MILSAELQIQREQENKPFCLPKWSKHKTKKSDEKDFNDFSNSNLLCFLR